RQLPAALAAQLAGLLAARLPGGPQAGLVAPGVGLDAGVVKGGLLGTGRGGTEHDEKAGEQPDEGQHDAIPGVNWRVGGGRLSLSARRRRLDPPSVTGQWQELACSPVLRPAPPFFRSFPLPTFDGLYASLARVGRLRPAVVHCAAVCLRLPPLWLRNKCPGRRTSPRSPLRYAY